MKYVFLSNYQCLKKSFKVILFYCLFLIFCLFILNNFQFEDKGYDNYVMLLGLSFNYKSMISVCFYFLNIFIIIYLTISLFIKDIMMGNINILLRINTKKWLLYKIVILFTIIILLKILFHLLICRLSNVIPIYLKMDLLFSFSLSLLSILLLIFIKKNYFIVIFFIIICLLGYYNLTVVNLSIYIYYIISAILLEILMILLFDKKIIELFDLGGNV